MKWKCWFEQYCEVSELAEKGELCPVSTLLYCLGEEAEEVLDITCITADDRKKYMNVIDKFDNFLK